MSDVCQRCGCAGRDRRTLHMACFYAMNELGVPFGDEIVLYADEDRLELVKPPDEIEVGERKITLGSGLVRCTGELRPSKQFTLRVCKRCRAEWMHAIKVWFNDKPGTRDDDADGDAILPEGNGTGTGIFVRENGVKRELTEREVKERWPDHDPNTPWSTQ